MTTDQWSLQSSSYLLLPTNLFQINVNFLFNKSEVPWKYFAVIDTKKKRLLYIPVSYTCKTACSVSSLEEKKYLICLVLMIKCSLY